MKDTSEGGIRPLTRAETHAVAGGLDPLGALLRAIGEALSRAARKA
ncbi:MAG: hypothetical protein AB7O57_00900 [Hyphomicrobiaceae bacterium]